jgi:murein DD-endopeptidase MepM/ murein hydrolase activator NlpD
VPPPAPPATAPAADAGMRPDAASSAGSASPPAAPTGAPPEAGEPAPPPLPQLKEEPSSPATAAGPGGKKYRRAKTPRVKPVKTVPTDVILESQNHSLAIARRYAQLLSSGRYDEARLMHEEEGGRRPDWTALRAAVRAHNEVHGTPVDIEQHLVTWTGAELLTFFFTAHYKDGSELPMRVAIDHHGNVSGAGVGSELIPATKKRYDRYDNYKTRNVLSLPFYGSWMVSNATPGAGNGHYLNANQRFAIDFYIVDEVEPGKRRSHRDRGRQNIDYFAYGQDVLAPADGTVVMVVDGIPDNNPGQVDIYYRLGNSVVINLGNGEFAHLCHLQNGSPQVRIGDKVTRGQVVAKCGNSGNSTSPHLHFQLTDGPLISHAASLPAYFSGIIKDGIRQPSVLPQSGDRLTNPAEPPTAKAARTAAP